MDEQIIFDLDGTLADNRHREYLIEGEDKQWRKYLAKCAKDSPVQKMISMLNEMSEEYEIIILTCRSDEVEEETVEWLEEHGVNYDRLIMLPKGKWSTSDHEFKRGKLKELTNPVMAFDDKQSNCKMFFEEGLKVFHVEDLPEPVFKRIKSEI
jgi:uncharacterized HAD superfamily protein